MHNSVWYGKLDKNAYKIVYLWGGICEIVGSIKSNTEIYLKRNYCE